jgi:hypothetical protein
MKPLKVAGRAAGQVLLCAVAWTAMGAFARIGSHVAEKSLLPAIDVGVAAAKATRRDEGRD